MRKTIVLTLLTFTISNSFGQSITKLGFKKINKEVRSIIYSIDSEKDFNIITENFNLNEEQSKSLQKVANKYRVPFNLGKKRNINYMFPFYLKSEIDNRLFLTIVTINDSNTKSEHKKDRCQYFFILQCNVGLNKTYNVIFENINLITDENGIEKWFLEGYKDYVKNTKIIYNLYDYVPPPPFVAPNTLE